MEPLSSLLGTLWGFLRCLFLTLSIEPWIKWTSVREEKPITTYEQWHAWQFECDALRGVDDWATVDRDACYDWQVLRSLKRDLERSRRLGDDRALCSQLRAQSSRNVCRILSSHLYRKSGVQTKALIHDYIREVRQCIAYMADRNCVNGSAGAVVPLQEKRQVLHDMRKALGRTSLLLQGGAMISMAHLGVVKALFLQGLLPQIVTGTATGALIGALVCTTRDDALMAVLNGHNVDIDAFARAKVKRSRTNGRWTAWFGSTFLATVRRRYKRYRATRHLFDIEVLRECVRDNLGDVTFEEAYAKTGRILNITIAMSEVTGTPQLLNYVTAPHVLIWSAVVASIATSKEMYAPVQLFCKSETGAVTRYFAADFSERNGRRQAAAHLEAPLQRIGELFNVNHFIVSQTRPYVAPFIEWQRWANAYQPLGVLVRLCFSECLHWLSLLDHFGVLPTPLQRVLVDEVVPSLAKWAKLSITPQLGVWDVVTMFDPPTAAKLQRWSERGERCTWPFIAEVRCRCDIEFALDAAYASLRRRHAVVSPPTPTSTA